MSYCTTTQNNSMSALRAARDFQKGLGPLPPYAVVRMLEKRKLIYVYRHLSDLTEYPAPKRNQPDRTVLRRTIYAITLTHAGLVRLGVESQPLSASGWMLD